MTKISVRNSAIFFPGYENIKSVFNVCPNTKFVHEGRVHFYDVLSHVISGC